MLTNASTGWGYEDRRTGGKKDMSIWGYMSIWAYEHMSIWACEHMSNRHPVTIGSALLSQAVYTLLIIVRFLQHILDCLEGLKFLWETVCIHGPAYPWGGTSLETVRCAKDYAKNILKKTPEVLSNVNLGKPLCGNLAYACPMYTADMHIAHTPVFVNAYMHACASEACTHLNLPDIWAPGALGITIAITLVLHFYSLLLSHRPSNPELTQLLFPTSHQPPLRKHHPIWEFQFPLKTDVPFCTFRP